jgi:hypothetical protein
MKLVSKAQLFQQIQIVDKAQNFMIIYIVTS